MKSENLVETSDIACQEEYPTPVKNLIQAADRAAFILTSQPTQAVAEWMAALPNYSRQLTEWKPFTAKDIILQPQPCSQVMKEGEPATLPRRSTSDAPFHVNNSGKLHRNFQVTISMKGGRDVVVTPDTTSPPNLAKSEEPQKHTITLVDTEQLMAPAPEVPN